MADTEAGIGWGGEFWLANESGTLIECAEVISISMPNPQVSDVEATHFKSPNRRREYIAGLIEDGEGTFGFNYVPGGPTDVLIRGALEAGTARAYKVVLPVDDETWVVEGDMIVKGYEREIPIDDRMTSQMTGRFTGDSTEAAGA